MYTDITKIKQTSKYKNRIKMNSFNRFFPWQSWKFNYVYLLITEIRVRETHKTFFKLQLVHHLEFRDPLETFFKNKNFYKLNIPLFIIHTLKYLKFKLSFYHYQSKAQCA